MRRLTRAARLGRSGFRPRLPALALALILLPALLSLLPVPPSGPDLPAGPAAWLAASGAAQAQGAAELDAGSPPETLSATDYENWDSIADRVEQVIGRDRESDETLKRLRVQIANWRDHFSAAMAVEDPRLQTLNQQLTALGPAPAEGTSEAADLARQRKDLGEAIARAEAPAKVATAAHSRADGLVREIDAKLRERQTAALLTTVPAPINPANWPGAFSAIRAGLAAQAAAVTDSVTAPGNLETFRRNLPLVLLLGLGGLLLVLRGGRLLRRLTRRLQMADRPRLRQLIAWLLSLGEVLLPVLGTLMLFAALEVSALLPGTADTAGKVSLTALPLMLASVFLARWLASWIFPPNAVGLLGTAPAHARELRLHGGILGALVSLDVAVTAFLGDIPAAGAAMLGLLTQALAALFLFRFAILLRRHGVTGASADEARGFREQLLRLVSGAVLVISVVAPVLAAVGYVELGRSLIWPTVLTLALAGLVILLQQVATDIYAVVSHDSKADEALIPVLVSFFLALVALPVLALIWGVTPTQLQEFWTQARNGFDIEGIRLSPGVFLVFLVVFAAGYTATRMLQGALRTTILPRTKLDKGGRNAVVAGVGYLGIFLAGLLAVTAAGINLSSLAFIAGALSLGIGFGLQNIVQNFVSGIILLIERPVGEGDWIEAGGRQGIVKAISVRSTRIETFDRTEVIVPNADLVSGQVVNWTRGNPIGRVIVPVGVAYGSDTRRVEKILSEIALAHPLVTMNPEPRVIFVGFGADSLDFEIRAMISDISFGVSTKSDMNHEIARRFAEEGIEIPFGQRDLWLRNPEAVAEAVAEAMAARQGEGETAPEDGTGLPDEGGDAAGAAEAEGPR